MVITTSRTCSSAVHQPKLLRDLGWKVTFVLAKDWYEDHAAVLDRLDRLLAGGEELPEDDKEEKVGLIDEVGDEDPQDAFFKLEVDSSAQPAVEAQVAKTVEEFPEPTESGRVKPRLRNQSPPVVENHTRRFAFTGGSSNKFGKNFFYRHGHTVRFGRIGTKGQTVKRRSRTL